MPTCGGSRVSEHGSPWPPEHRIDPTGHFENERAYRPVTLTLSARKDGHGKQRCGGGHMMGYVDRIGLNSIVGWVERTPDRADPHTVQALFRGNVIGTAVASGHRPDVAQVTNGDPNCGFVIAIEPPYDVDEIDVMVEGRPLPRAQQPAGGDVADLIGSVYQLAPERIDRPLRVTTARSSPSDIAICERLIAAYRDLLPTEDQVFAGRRSMWSGLLHSNYRNLRHILARGSPRELCEYLLYIHKRPESWGISQGPESYYLLRNAAPTSAVHRAHAALYASELLSLAEYLGLIPVENLGQGRLHENVDLAAIVRAIEAKIGIDPIFPHAAGGLYCLDTGAGLVQQRDVWALYGALRIADLLRDSPTKHVCEIGGGLGQLCTYARRLGVERYVLIDLPHVSLLQAFQVMRAHPDLRIALHEGGAFDPDADICIYPTFMYERAPDGWFDVTVNVDSMPEMGWDNALSYARAAAAKSAAFLSINQEARAPLGIAHERQVSVTEVFAKVPEFRQAYRFRSWVRRGYLESYFTRSASRAASEPRAVDAGIELPHYEGYLDAIGPEMIAGWARNIDDPGQPVELDILIDGHVIARSKADAFSAALRRAGISGGRHAFATRLPVALFDGKPHQVAVRIAGTDLDLRQSPASIELPSIERLGPIIARSLATEPWIIDRVSLEGASLTLGGWAIPPPDGPAAAGFLINGAAFDAVDWPKPRGDIHQLFFYKVHADRTGFELRADLSRIRASGATELVLRYCRMPTGDAINKMHDYHFPLRRRANMALPDASRRKRVAGTTDPLLFELGGYTLLRKIELLLAERYATSIDKVGRILDWGCGCGRLLRFLVERASRPDAILGTDVDADNVAWCQANLGEATTCTTPLLPPSPFAGGQFDLILGNSVFTHLGEQAQIAWLEELSRILAAGGIVMVSVQTITNLPHETFHPAAYDRLLRYGFISEKTDDALSGVISDGEYYRSAFHTHDYIRSVWSRYFEIDDIIPQLSNNMQDLVLMRRRR